MAKNPTSPISCINHFISVEFKNAKKYTAQKCRWALEAATEAIIGNGFDASPYRIDDETVKFLMEKHWKPLNPVTIKGYVSYLNRYLRFYNNNTIKNMKIVWPQDMRINVDWLTDEQDNILMTMPMTILERTVVHLELCMGLRSVEVCRLMLNEIKYGNSPHIDVRGKGRGTGKYRSVSFHSQTSEVFKAWLEEREKIVARVRSHNPNWVDPGNFLIWCHYKHKPEAGAYSEMGGSLDVSVIEPVRKRAGFHFANHTLRRTFGRNLFHAKVPLETIAKFLGHSSTTETLKYIGVNLDDMDEGMAKLAKYQQEKLRNGGLI
jgi:Site-specific recombinase XerC